MNKNRKYVIILVIIALLGFWPIPLAFLIYGYAYHAIVTKDPNVKKYLQYMKDKYWDKH